MAPSKKPPTPTPAPSPAPRPAPSPAPKQFSGGGMVNINPELYAQPGRIPSGREPAPKEPATPAGPTTTTEPSGGMTDYERYLVASAANSESSRQQNATEAMRALMQQYGLMSLYSKVVGYIQDGYDPEAIGILIRTTPEYKTRFPAMDALAAKGRTISEASYIEYESSAATLERRYGLPEGMLMSNVTKLLTNEVSPSELNDRVILASAASIQAPQEIKDMFKNYYNIDSGGLTAYFLDPDVATPLLEKQNASAIIGAEAAKQGIGIDVNSAENLQNIGITQNQAREGFGTVAGATGLSTGAGDIVSQQDLVAATLGNNAEAKKRADRAAGGRLGRFQGGGEFLKTQQGASGLGSASTS